MSNALLSDVEARAVRRRTRLHADMWRGLAQQAMDRAKAATDPAEALRWLERTHRLAPRDRTVALSLASASFASGDVRRATRLFREEAERHGTPQAWAGLGACAHVSGDPAAARAALLVLLRSCAPDATTRQLAEAVAGPAGWCGLNAAGIVQSGAVRPASLRLDGRALRGGKLPSGWRKAVQLDVIGPDGPMLGSPLPLAPFCRVDGFVAAVGGGIQGWAWYPADPGRAPRLEIGGPLGRRAVLADEPAPDIDIRPLARPFGFALSSDQVEGLGTPIAVRSPDGRHLWGSPLDPGIEAGGRFVPCWVDTPAGVPRTDAARRAVEVVIPVFRDREATAACLASVLETVPAGTRVVVVDDASPDADLVRDMQALAQQGRIVLIRHAENRGFPAAANAGLAAAEGRDVVLLNSDTLVPPGWLQRLAEAAYSAPDIGTVTPLTNDGTVVSYPDPEGGNQVPSLADTLALDALARKAGAGVVDLPVGVGFCLYLRRDCLNQVGVLREDLFAQGYGEENDLCLRARRFGWRNVAAPNIVVGHRGATSFGAAREHLIRRNGETLERLHPGYGALVARHVAADPLLAARRSLDAARFAAGRRRGGAVLFVTHGGGGGVDRVVERRAAEAAEAGRRPLLLRPARTRSGAVAVRVDEPGQAWPNLVFEMPEELPGLVRLLQPQRPRAVEQHHMLGHHADLARLPALLGVEATVVIHDYAQFCPRIALVSTERRYCGEPDIPGCEACIADLGSLLEDDPPVRSLIARSAAMLDGAARIVAPSHDAAVRLGRHFPGIRPTVEPWEDDASWPPCAHPAPGGPCRVVIVGAIGIEKGFEVLLGCVRDAASRALPMEFVVVGFTADDERLMQAGPAFVTGEYKEDGAVALIQAQQGTLALIPSVWPETWCFALSRAWQAGLEAAVFDLGAQAERVRRTGRGWVLPLGMAARALNDTLLRLGAGVAQAAPPSHSPPRADR